jgi:hypothetical protein
LDFRREPTVGGKKAGIARDEGSLASTEAKTMIKHLRELDAARPSNQASVICGVSGRAMA